MIKRTFDILFSAIGLVVLSPVIAFLARRIGRTMGRPVFFRQIRPGKDGKPFEMLKFRTMRDTTGLDGVALPDEERLTPLGQTLRAASLDELPELRNVLKGDMDPILPCPLLMECWPIYTESPSQNQVR